MKPYSDDTNDLIDTEIRAVVAECYARTKVILTEKKELINNLAEKLLEKESINLPEILKVLGERPFPMKESVRTYLQELTEREEKEEIDKQNKEDLAESARKGSDDAAETTFSMKDEDKKSK
jgi:AFG3 family protein